MTPPLAATDLDQVLADVAGLWDGLRGRRLFLTGGTGYYGCWLLESFARANRECALGASAVVLTRDPDGFRAKAPHLARDPAIHLWPGDVRRFRWPAGEFSHVIHAATPATGGLLQTDPLAMFDVVTAGTRRVLEFARQRGAARVLLVSTGAVYGKQPPDLPRLAEDYAGAPGFADPDGAYAEGKRAAELLAAIYLRGHGVATTIARCFSTVGPRLPLDDRYAIGNFLRDALEGRPARVKGDGTPYRTYLYAADLAAWLWRVLLAGQPGHAYNVGSEAELTIADAARLVARLGAGRGDVVIGQTPRPGVPPERYVPSTERARCELGARERVGLEDAICRTLAWHRAADTARPDGA